MFWMILIMLLDNSFLSDLYSFESSQVVGWPPIRTHRINSLVNQAKTQRAEEEKTTNEKEKPKDALKKKINNFSKTSTPTPVQEKGHLGFVKVNMDGIAIGRKVDLNAHSCYETLAQTLEDMFFRSTITVNSMGQFFCMCIYIYIVFFTVQLAFCILPTKKKSGFL